jgi:hypothetical protein
VRAPSQARYVRSAEALSRRVGSDVLVLLPEDDEMHELSGGATAVWEELREPRTLEDLVGRLSSRHGEQAGAIAPQIEACLESLVGLRLVREVQGFIE